MGETLTFAGREEFREWLSAHCQSSSGVWLLFGKAGGPKTIGAEAALEEALCFGWIDGVMERLDEKTYRKYFSRRRAKSKWSEKNKKMVEKLEAEGRMTDFGREKVREARENGRWDEPDLMALTAEQVAYLSVLLAGHEPAYTNFQAMPPSVKKTYARAYYDAKTEAGRARRLAWIVDRLNQNLRPG